jgi:orotidine-5'-phosphate decarboxylase
MGHAGKSNVCSGRYKGSGTFFYRKIIPSHFLLIPGVGTQGGSLSEVCKYGLTEDGGLLINASRAIIYAGNDANFAKEAATAAKQYQSEMRQYL